MGKRHTRRKSQNPPGARREGGGVSISGLWKKLLATLAKVIGVLSALTVALNVIVVVFPSWFGRCKTEGSRCQGSTLVRCEREDEPSLLQAVLQAILLLKSFVSKDDQLLVLKEEGCVSCISTKEGEAQCACAPLGQKMATVAGMQQFCDCNGVTRSCAIEGSVCDLCDVREQAFCDNGDLVSCSKPPVCRTAHVDPRALELRQKSAFGEACVRPSNTSPAHFTCADPKAFACADAPNGTRKVFACLDGREQLAEGRPCELDGWPASERHRCRANVRLERSTNAKGIAIWRENECAHGCVEGQCKLACAGLAELMKKANRSTPNHPAHCPQGYGVKVSVAGGIATAKMGTEVCFTYKVHVRFNGCDIPASL